MDITSICLIKLGLNHYIFWVSRTLNMTSITFDDTVNQDLDNLNKVRNLRCMQALNSELSWARALRSSSWRPGRRADQDRLWKTREGTYWRWWKGALEKKRYRKREQLLMQAHTHIPVFLNIEISSWGNRATGSGWNVPIKMYWSQLCCFLIGQGVLSRRGCHGGQFHHPAAVIKGGGGDPGGRRGQCSL